MWQKVEIQGSISPDLDAQGKPTKYNYCINDMIESTMNHCRSGVCVSGWTGTLCDKRDCDKNNGGCNSRMDCTREIVNNVMREKCICKDNLVSYMGTECLDIARISDNARLRDNLIYSAIAICGIATIIFILVSVKCSKKELSVYWISKKHTDFWPINTTTSNTDMFKRLLEYQQQYACTIAINSPVAQLNNSQLQPNYLQSIAPEKYQFKA
ncbi:hypothetical protein HELRODRAFT_193182 [Helobdella robusta]|uniref:Uncharacterized protein n=1 Tax=Helobdella robusta TaxID=6412 RepID=T1FUQ0_HELRO|nr:hypothetical protein HELRODRAFT_193182 [Helobdella robusta]ESN97703.1 hypothetical protein HELRODRAFT_193182 [Helobdella robusta]